MILTDLRLRIDGLAQIVTKEEALIASPELQSCIKKLYFAKAWAGKLLGELGVDSPYKNDGKRKTVDDIEPTNDVSTDIPDMSGKNHIEAIDAIRQEVQRLIDLVETLEMSPKPTREISICRTNTWNYLCEARFELGFHLGILHKRNS